MKRGLFIGGALLAITGGVLGVAGVTICRARKRPSATACTLGPFAYVLVGALAYLETAGGMGLIAPGEIAVILGGVGASQGELSLPGLIALVWA